MCSEYNAYNGVGRVVPVMIATNAYASSTNPNRVRSDVGRGSVTSASVGILLSTRGCRRDFPSGVGGRRQWVTAFSAPIPVSERTSISAFRVGSPGTFDVTVPTMPSRNASGIDTIPGLASGNQAKATLGIIGVLARDTAGEKTINAGVEISPPYMLHSAPRVLNRFQYSE